MGGDPRTPHVVVVLYGGDGGGGRSVHVVDPFGRGQRAVEIPHVVHLVVAVGADRTALVVLHEGFLHPPIVVIVDDAQQAVTGAKHIGQAAGGKSPCHIALSHILVLWRCRAGEVVPVVVAHRKPGVGIFGMPRVGNIGIVPIGGPALPQGMVGSGTVALGIHFGLHIRPLSGNGRGEHAGRYRTPKGVVLGERPLVARPLVGVLAEHQLVKPVVDHVLPAPARYLLLHQSAPAIIAVAVDGLVEHRLRLVEAADVLPVPVHRRGKHIAEVAQVVVHIVRTQAFCAGLPGPPQHHPAIKIPVLFGSAGIPIGGLPVLVPDGRFIEPAGLVIAGSGAVAGAVDAPQLHLVCRIGAVGRTDRMVVGSPGRGLPCRAREALLHHSVQWARLENRDAVGAGGLHHVRVPPAGGLVVLPLRGDAGGLIAPVASRLLGIGKVLLRLTPKGIVFENLYQIFSGGAALPGHRLQRPAKAVKILDRPVGLAHSKAAQGSDSSLPRYLYQRLHHVVLRGRGGLGVRQLPD